MFDLLKKPLHLGVASLAAMACLGPAILSAQVPVDELKDVPELARGWESLRQGRLAEALASFQVFKASNPNDSRGYFHVGLALAAAERYQEAASELGEAVRLAPTSLQCRVALATVFGQLQRYQDGIDALRTIDGERLDQAGEAQALWLLSDLYFQKESFADVRRVLDRYRQLVVDDPRTTLRLGQVHLLETRFEEAEKAFREGVSLTPLLAPVHHGLGLSLLGQNRLQEALPVLRRAVELAPEELLYRLDLGRMLNQMGRFEEALPHLEKASSAEDAPAAALLELSRALRRTGREEEADRQLERFRQLDKRTSVDSQTQRRASTRLEQAQDLLGQGLVNEAREEFLKVLEGDPDNWPAHSYLAKIYLSSGLPREAFRHLDRLRAIDPKSAEGDFLFASYWYLVRDLRQALAAALKARSSRPDYAEVRNLLGNIYLAQGRRREAVAEYEAAVRLAPDREDFQLNLRTARGGK